MKKSIIISLVVIIAIIVIGGFLACKSSLVSRFMGENSKDTSWQGFWFNGYTFEHPSSWNVWMTFEEAVPVGCFAQGDSVCVNSNRLALSVNVIPWDEKTCKNYYNGLGGPKATLTETKELAGKQFLYGKFEDDNLEIYHTFLNGSCYEIAKTISDDQDLNKILSTFKFTK